MVVDIQGLTKRYLDGASEVTVLQDTVLALAAGESLAVTGPSGSGKSTLLNILAGVIPFDSGIATLNLRNEAYPLHQMQARALTRMRRQHVGYVHQFYNLVPTLTALENVQLPGRLNRNKYSDTRAQSLLHEFGLADRVHHFPDMLSGGEQQRVAVARAVVLKPPLILADEPTGNLDAENAQQVANLLFSHAREIKATVVVATHSETVAASADRHLVLGQSKASS